MSTGWLVNDCLTCIPGTKTFWHDLLEWLPELKDKTNGYTNFDIIANKVEGHVKVEGAPSYIIRNATFFRRLNIPCKQVCLLQDCYDERTQQKDVCNSSDVTVFNSNFTYSKYKNDITECDIKVIPLGTDFNLFNKSSNKHEDVLPNSILFVGNYNVVGKRIDIILDLVETTNYNFCLVMKDDFKMDHPRVSVFNRVDHETLVRIYNSCEMLICASPGETQHLASIEAGACGLPIITANSGALYNVPSGEWGLKESDNNYLECIEYIKNHKEEFSPREFLLKNKFDKDSCKTEWVNLIEELNYNV